MDKLLLFSSSLLVILIILYKYIFYLFFILYKYICLFFIVLSFLYCISESFSHCDTLRLVHRLCPFLLKILLCAAFQVSTRLPQTRRTCPAQEQRNRWTLRCRTFRRCNACQTAMAATWGVSFGIKILMMLVLPVSGSDFHFLLLQSPVNFGSRVLWTLSNLLLDVTLLVYAKHQGEQGGYKCRQTFPNLPLEFIR